MKRLRAIRGVYVIAALVVLLSACRNDTPNGGGDGEPVMVDMRFANPLSASPDEQIERVRVIVFNNREVMVSNELVPIISDPGAEVTVRAKMVRGLNNVYVVCNETAELGTSLAAVTNQYQIERTAFKASGIQTLIPMYGKVLGANVVCEIDGSNATVTVEGHTSSTLNVKVNRLLAKVSMTVIKDTRLAPHPFTVEKVSYKICRIATQMTLGQTPVEQVLWADNIEQSSTTRLAADGTYNKKADGDFEVVSGDWASFPDVYIPEHLLVDKEDYSKGTYMVVTALCKMEGTLVELNSIYQFDLGNRPPTNLDIDRNTQYKIYATIVNLGAMGFYAEIVPMKEYQVPFEWKPFEGYTIVSEELTQYSKNANIWNDYGQYTGLLKITTSDKVVQPALFRYGSVVALKDKTTGGVFDPATDILWQPTVTPAAASWADVGYLASGDISASGNTLDQVKLGLGDPCRLAGLTNTEIAAGVVDNQLWRMATADEMQWLVTARNEQTNANGFYTFHWLLTPNTGYRTELGVSVPALGGGYYWSATDRQALSFATADNTGQMAQHAPEKAYAVRCIRTDIPASRMEVMGRGGSYLGQTDVRVGLQDQYLVPFWKIRALPPVEGITFTKSWGTYSEQAIFDLSPVPNPYDGRATKVEMTGYGLDGVVHVHNFEIRQDRLVHQITIELKEPTDLPTANGYLRIPKQGAVLKIGMAIDPYPYAPYAADYPNKTWHAVATWYDSQSRSIDGSSAKSGELSSIVIPPNDFGHILGISINFQAENTANFPPHSGSSGNRTIVLIQEK